MEEVEWMLARNGVNIHYLNILSNEFASASKDPTEGFEPCALGPLLEEVGSLIDQFAPDRVRARVRAADDLPEVTCHPAALKRLLMNLALNAVDAIIGEQDEQPGTIELAVEPDPKGGRVAIQVCDNGPGIPEPILENLRAIYRQVRSSADALSELESIAESVRSTKDQGFKEHYGLGFLFVCQTVHQHNGGMKIESRPGHGARFIITLPLHPKEAGAESTSEDTLN